jgi:broad specificity phosphatase PhoE
MTRLILVRHGETDWNREGRYMGQTDQPLNDKGLAQAEAAAHSLQGTTLAAIYTSDLRRARQTAEAMARTTGATVVVDRRLRELGQGNWEGQLFSHIEQVDAELLARRRTDPMDTRPPGGESVREAQGRVLPLLAELAHRYPTDRVAVVSHGGLLAVIKAYLLDLPAEAVWDQIPDHASPEEFTLEAE